jgi:peptidoglycan/xylan/chitin deacetylase (PgdA/CDA1 family)
MRKLTSNPFLYFLILWVQVPLFAQQRQICITVDDLPTVAYGENNELKITEKLIQHFDKYRIPAVGFVNEGKLFYNNKLVPRKLNLIRYWLENGYELGNHTYSHLDYNNSSFEKFTGEIIKGEILTKPLSEEFNLPWRYFRHPFLHVGPNKEKADSLSTFLSENNYIEAPVTIDNADYIFAKAYSNASKAKDEVFKKRIGKDYVNYMEAKIKYFGKLTNRLFDRQIPQILLTHANLINADYYDDLAEMYLRNGYEFITLETALQDPAYKTEITAFGSYGISWLDRWALSREGFDRSILQEDPETPEYITKAAK